MGARLKCDQRTVGHKQRAQSTHARTLTHTHAQSITRTPKRIDFHFTYAHTLLMPMSCCADAVDGGDALFTKPKLVALEQTHTHTHRHETDTTHTHADTH